MFKNGIDVMGKCRILILVTGPTSAPSSVSSSPPNSTNLTHHPLDSLLTPAASPEEDPLETWIQTV